jgi:hypothetical protein
MFSSTYQEWLHCITRDCGIELTPSFIERRLAELRDNRHPKTLEFIRLYGERYTQQVIAWFEQAQNDQAKSWA